MNTLVRFQALIIFVFAGLCHALQAKPETLLEDKGVRLCLDAGRVQIYREKSLLVEVCSFEFNFRGPKSLVVGERAEDRIILRAVYPSESQHREQPGDLAVDIQVERIAGGFHFTARPAWATQTTLQLSDLEDHFFGVLEQLSPRNMKSPDLRGAVVDVDSQGSDQAYHENYASVWSAFFMTDKGCASFFDTFAKGRYRLGLEGRTELHHQTGALDWYVFTGGNGDALLAAYYRVIGAPKAPPMWALGPIGWRDQNNGGSAEILDDVRQMSDLRIPFTAWFVDRPYSNGENAWSKMDFNEKFENPRAWIAELEDRYGLKFMTWVAPMTFGDPAFPGLLPGDHGYLDLSDPYARMEWRNRLKPQYAAGVRGHKNDRGEERFPEMSGWKDGTPQAERRNKYLYLYAKVTHEMLEETWGASQFNFARGAFHRSQPYLSAVWGGDSRGSWDGLAANLANAMRCGFMGFPVWGTDVGGYFGGRIDEELYARWLAWGAWNGLFEIKLDDAGGQNLDRPPWAYGEPLKDAFRDACAQRMDLLPYLYSITHTAGRTGVVMKPLAYLWPSDRETHAIWDQYMFGPAFLVAPITAPGGERSVYLPEGHVWYDYHAPRQSHRGGKRIKVKVPLNRVPVFVRDNSIHVTGTLPLGNRKLWEGEAKPFYIIHAVPCHRKGQVEFELIDSLDEDRPKILSLANDMSEVRFTLPELGAAGEVRVRFEPPAQIKVNGRPINARYDPDQAVYRIPFQSKTACEIEIVRFVPGR